MKKEIEELKKLSKYGEAAMVRTKNGIKYIAEEVSKKKIRLKDHG